MGLFDKLKKYNKNNIQKIEIENIVKKNSNTAVNYEKSFEKKCDLEKLKKITEAEIRRDKSKNIIKKLNIEFFELLPDIESILEFNLKSIDDICKRAIACLISIQFALDLIENKNYNKLKKNFVELLRKYDVENSLILNEKKLLDNNFTNQNLINVIWTYEAYWALVWVLGFVDEIEIPKDVCDCKKAIEIVLSCEDYNEFKGKCNLRSVEEILNMLDLYYRYHWVCTEKRIKPETSIGILNPDVVVERRRGLEWVMSKEYDWNEIPLDT